MFSWLGVSMKRLNRSSFFINNLIAMFAIVAIGLVIDGLFQLVFGVSGIGAAEGGYTPSVVFIMIYPLYFGYLYYNIVRRLHDMSISGWWAIGVFISMLIPLVNFLTGLWLLFKPGTKEANKYGEPLNGVYLFDFKANLTTLLVSVAITIVTLGALGIVLAVIDSSINDNPRAGIGDVVRDGDFEFIISQFECGIELIVTEEEFPRDYAAKGEFCIMNLSVKNKGQTTKSLPDYDQLVIDDNDKEFNRDIIAGIELNDTSPILNDINPGDTLEVKLAFDVPVGSNIVLAELHDGSYPPVGVRVNLHDTATAD